MLTQPFVVMSWLHPKHRSPGQGGCPATFSRLGLMGLEGLAKSKMQKALTFFPKLIKK
jgi:hypothetical protein